MKPEKYLVTTFCRDKTKTQIWDSSSPLAIDYQFNWILENGNGNLQIRNLSTSTQQSESNPVIPISKKMIEEESKIQLFNQLGVKLRLLRTIPPAYHPPSGQTQTGGKPLQLLAFTGSGKSLSNCEPVPSAYIGYSREKPIFTLVSSGDGYQIKPLLPGLQLKLKNQRPVPGREGGTWKLQSSDLANCTLVRASRWWRFTFVAISDFQFDLKVQYESETELATGRLFRILMVALLTLLIAFGAVVSTLRSPTQPIQKEELEAPIVKFVAQKPKAPLPIKEQVQAAPAPMLPPAPALPPPAPPPPLHQPKNVKSKVPQPSPKQLAQKASSQKLAALREIMGSALALPKKSTHSVGNDSHPTAGLFDSKSATLNPTEVKPGFSGGNSKIEGFGGKDGSGYSGSTGIRSNSAKGGSFVSVDGQGMEVQKGLLREEVGAVIHSHMSEIRYCHESAMLSNPNIGGKLVVQFSISPGGTVETSKTESSTLGDPNLESCIISRLRTWKFPKPKGGIHVAVSYPFIFKVLERE